ncbi:MAG: transglycosylase SLT domain-containing protein [Desulfobacterales bacterium]|nr:transglycosylase SLT domain-containing protein [Desulfobacterales bacterium]
MMTVAPRLRLFFFWILLLLAVAANAEAQRWGQLRTASIPVTILAERHLDAAARGQILPGQWVKVDFLGHNWVAVFPKEENRRDESRAQGYAYAPLLKPYSYYMENIWEAVEENNHDPRVSLSEEFCKLKDSYDENALSTIVPQLSRLDDHWREDLPEMLQRRTIRVLTTYSPSTYFIFEGRSYGFEYSLLKDFETFINRRFRRKATQTVLEFIPVPENLLIPCLQIGIGDMVAAGIRRPPQDIDGIDFTIPYLQNVSDVLITHRQAPAINLIEDLAGRRIHIQPAWQQSKTLRRIDARLLVTGRRPLNRTTTNGFLSSEDILELVNEGVIDLSIVESHIARLWSSVYPDIVILEFPEISAHTPIAWAVRRDNPEFKASLDRFLRGRQRGSWFGNIYYRQYFKETRWVSNPLIPTDHAKFSRYAPLFRKYGSRYGFDWMLLAAIAYQESQMKNRRRSHAGAVGLMQVMPTTAGDANVDIDNIWDPEQNVHAGSKYLALLRDVYFPAAEYSPQERIHFILAAYNAGPGKIARCRRLAVRMGNDPRKWFGHTELAARRLIGNETVRYVSNVSKYYMAYSLGHTMECLKHQQIERLKSDHKAAAPIALAPVP